MTEERKLTTGDKSLLKAAQTGEGAIPLTEDVFKAIGKSLDARFDYIKEQYPKLVEECPYETRLAVVAWAMKHIVDHAKEGGSYRYLIYDRLGFGMDAYVPLCDDGMTISNEFVISEASPKDDEKLAKKLLEDLWPGNTVNTVTFEGGKEPWLTVCEVASRLQGLSEALATEHEKRARVEAELKDAKNEQRR